jgi:hypothetical protein
MRFTGALAYEPLRVDATPSLRCHGIQRLGSGKKPVSQVRRQLAAQRPGLQLLLIELQPG